MKLINNQYYKTTDKNILIQFLQIKDKWYKYKIIIFFKENNKIWNTTLIVETKYKCNYLFFKERNIINYSNYKKKIRG